jgi:DNA topoisomerase-1
VSDIENLLFVNDKIPGISRSYFKNKPRYFDINGHQILDELEITRINALAIPPAWTDVWICPDKNGHIQATGRDAKSRKQYRYHNSWRTSRDEAKYKHMIDFGHSLPLIRQGIAKALKLPGLPQEKVLAVIIELMQLTMIRVGNDEYAKQNHSYGLTTLLNRHLEINGTKLNFQFKGKSGVKHKITISDKKLAALIKSIRDLPGQELFQYLDENDEQHSVSSSELNNYLRELTGENYTAKDFRTWYGTIAAVHELLKFERYASESEAKQNIVEAIKNVAKKLGNTPAICRKCYVHPLIITTYLNGTLSKRMPKLIDKQSADKAAKNKQEISVEELAILRFLKTVKS